jgi:hypothetical protein
MTTFTMLATWIGLAAVAASPLPAPQAAPKPKMKPMSQSEVDRQLSNMAGRPKLVSFKTLYLLGVSRLENGPASLALRFPSSVDGYGGAMAEMVGARGGSNTQNWTQSVIDIRFPTPHANKLHAMVVPVMRHALDTGNAEYEVRLNGQTFRRTIPGGTGAVMITWTPATSGFQTLGVKLLSPGRFFFEKVELKYLSN